MSYLNNKHAGTATAVATAVEGSGYAGSVSAEFTIKPAKITSMTLSTYTYTFNEKEKKPLITVKAKRGGKTVTLKDQGWNSNDYVTITWPAGRVYVGKYVIRATGKGDYSGTLTKTITINPRTTAFTKKVAWGKSIDVTWSKRVTQVTGYQVRYSTSKTMDNATKVTIGKTSTTKKSLTGLKLNTGYYLQVRTYKKNKSGNVYVSKWSDPAYVKTVREYSLSEGLHLKRTDFVKYMQRHEHDGYYLGTPYVDDELGYKGLIWPRGKPRSDGFYGFNCAGFVTKAIQDAGGDVSGIHKKAKTGISPGMLSAGAHSWYDYARYKGMKMTHYKTIKGMLASGELKKGDIIVSMPVSWSDYDADTHIMIFWGKTSHENKVWHTTVNCQISKIKPGCTRSTFYVLSMGD